MTARLALAIGALCAGPAMAGSVEILVLDRDGKPAPDSVVMVLPSGKGAPRQALPMSAVVTQEKQRFVPAVSLVAVGAKVTFTNADPWNHHVRIGQPGELIGSAEGYSAILEGKEDGKPMRSVTFTLDKAGAVGAGLLSCFIHSRMSGVVYVSESPWAAKTNSAGIAVVTDVPDGAATVRVWNPVQFVEKAPLSLTVTGAPVKATFQLDIAPKQRM